MEAKTTGIANVSLIKRVTRMSYMLDILFQMPPTRP